MLNIKSNKMFFDEANSDERKRARKEAQQDFAERCGDIEKDIWNRYIKYEKGPAPVDVITGERKDFFDKVIQDMELYQIPKATWICYSLFYIGETEPMQAYARELQEWTEIKKPQIEWGLNDKWRLKYLDCYLKGAYEAYALAHNRRLGLM